MNHPRPNRAPAVLFVAAMLAASPLVARAAAHDTPPPPPELTGLVATDIPGISARPNRIWTTTLRVLRANGVPVPADARWGYLPYDTEVGGVALINQNRVLVDPFTAAGDGRHLAATFAHEAAHLASHHAGGPRTTAHGDAMEEAAAEAVARDLVPVIWHRLRINVAGGAWAYHQQVSWLRRSTTRGCAATTGGTRHQVERCARHTRRWFLTASDAERRTFATKWAPGRVPGVRYPTTNPARPRTIAQQLQVERARWAAERRALRTEIRELHAASRFRPTVAHAVSLAAAVTGASRPAMVGLFTCEATMNPKAASPGGLYVGLGQFDAGTWGTTRLGRAGFDRTDPYAMAFATVELFDRRGRGPWQAIGQQRHVRAAVSHIRRAVGA